MGGLQVRIATIERKARAVIVQRDDFVLRLQQTAKLAPGGAVIPVLAILVDIVADMDHGIQLTGFGDLAIGIVEAGDIVRAGSQREADRRVPAGR